VRLTEVEREDRNHAAMEWALSQPSLRQLTRDLYVTRDTVEDARRFAASEEFALCLELVRGRLPASLSSPTLLDLGCGNGVASWAFAGNGFVVTAADVSPSDICGLGAAARLEGLDGVTFEIVRADGHELPFPENHFDVVFCRQALHHADDLAAFVRETARVLRHGGVLLATREQVAETQEQLQALLDSHPLNHITRDEKAFPKAQYLAAMREAGLASIQVIGIYDSVINFFPLPASELPKVIAATLGRVPGALARSARLRALLIPWLTRAHERRSHTIDTFVASKRR
jgi:SAM-dependent methyltransferase